jgi:hypothetical protein
MSRCGSKICDFGKKQAEKSVTLFAQTTFASFPKSLISNNQRFWKGRKNKNFAATLTHLVLKKFQLSNSNPRRPFFPFQNL